MVVPEMARLGDPHAYTTHGKTNEEKIHATWYLESNLTVATDPDVHLRFLALDFSY